MPGPIAAGILWANADTRSGPAVAHAYSHEPSDPRANVHSCAECNGHINVDADTASNRHTNCHCDADIDTQSDAHGYAHRDGCPFANPDAGGRQPSLVERFGLL